VSLFDHYAKQSTTSLGRWTKRYARQRQLEALRPYLPGPECAILEIGPGLGELTDLFLQAGYRNYTIVEPNDLLREGFAAKGVKTRSYVIPSLDEGDCTYDAIVVFSVLEHLNDTRDAQLFMREARRVLKPAGVVCVLSPDYTHWHTDFYNADYTHSFVTTPRRVAQLFCDGGFRVVEQTHYSGHFSGAIATLVSVLVKVALFLSRGNRPGSRLYKLKLSFLRCSLSVGRKEAPG